MQANDSSAHQRRGTALTHPARLEVTIDAVPWPHVVHHHDVGRRVLCGIEHTIAPYPNTVEGLFTGQPLAARRPWLFC